MLGPLHWRHNDHGGVSNHQPHGCLLNRLFRRRSKKTSKLRITGLCADNSPGIAIPGKTVFLIETPPWWSFHYGECDTKTGSIIPCCCIPKKPFAVSNAQLHCRILLKWDYCLWSFQIFFRHNFHWMYVSIIRSVWADVLYQAKRVLRMVILFPDLSRDFKSLMITPKRLVNYQNVLARRYGRTMPYYVWLNNARDTVML